MWNGRIRRVSASTGDLTTVAGSRLSPPTPEVSFHFHYDAESTRRDLDARVAVHDPNSDRVTARIQAVPVAGRDVPIRIALYPSLPQAAGRRPPLVVLLHGRSNHEWTPLEWDGLRSWAQLLAARGMSAAVVEHRLGSMPASLAAAEADVAAAMEHLIRDATSLGFDPARVCVLSFGGASALLARFASDPLDHLRCLAMFSPHTSLLPADLFDWFLESPADRERYSLSGAITAASPPLFLAIGSRDRSMLTESFRAFVQTAADRGVTVEVVEHPAGGHDFERLVHDDASRAAIERAVAFLISRLR